MITGFNTDVKHAERVYHVQTEDRGVANPVVESLVYVGGEILLSKKSPYRDLITGDRVDEKALREMMDLQHRRVIEAIRRGRLDKGKIGEAPSDWADDTLPSSDKVSPAALAAVHAILAAPPEPLPGAASAARAPAPKPAAPPPPRAASVAAPAAVPAAARGRSRPLSPAGARSCGVRLRCPQAIVGGVSRRVRSGRASARARACARSTR